MFTGLVQALGWLRQRQHHQSTARILVECGTLNDALTLGDSVAINGVCLTVSRLEPNGFWADVSEETLRRTTLNELSLETRLNLEPALRPIDRIGGHFVLGHVDGIGKILTIEAREDYATIVLELPQECARFVAAKGSLAVDGTSLTVAHITSNQCRLAIIPTTWRATNLQYLRQGDLVNIETDVLARYVERMAFGDTTGLTEEKLRAWGYE